MGIHLVDGPARLDGSERYLIGEARADPAAATAEVMPPSAIAADLVTLTVDRPFLFLIRDLQTGTVLFLGRVVDPSASVEG